MNPVNNNGALQMLQEMQALAEQAGGARAAEQEPEGPQFAEALRDALGTVNAAQQHSGDMQEAFVRGENVELVDVMIAMQKSEVAFEATKQVRTRLVEAYRDIYNMPV